MSFCVRGSNGVRFDGGGVCAVEGGCSAGGGIGRTTWIGVCVCSCVRERDCRGLVGLGFVWLFLGWGFL